MTHLSIPPGLQTYGTPLSTLLERQARAISTRQLHDCGVSSKVMTRLRRDGWIEQKHQGVWIVGGGKLAPEGAFWAGHLATGGTISYRSASVIHALRASFWKVEVTVEARRRGRAGLVVHEGKLPPEQIADHDGLPVTTLERTLLDLADVLNPRQLEIAINQADDHLDYAKLQALLATANGRRGITPLNDALRAHELGQTLTESVLEEEFLRLVRDYGFVQPKTQQYILGWRCDFVWPEHRIVIETDGARFHKHRERDGQRDRELRRAGWTVDRLTYRQVFFRPDECALILEGNGVPRVPSGPRRRAARRPRRAASRSRTA